MKVSFAGNILIIGNGAVSKCLQTLLIKNIEYDFRKITIIDRDEFEQHKIPLANYGAQFEQQEIQKKNYITILQNYLKPGDLLIDLGFCIESIDLVEWCQNNNVLFLNSSVEWWPDDEPVAQKNSVYEKYNHLFNRAKFWRGNKSTAIVDHGANPGLVNHWAKRGLEEVAHQFIQANTTDKRSFQLKEALSDNDFARIAMLTNTKVIQVSERDGQLIAEPKKENEFVNTWSIFSFHEESVAPSEVAWGSHEQNIPSFAVQHETGPQHELFLKKRALDVRSHSWVPSGPAIGIVIRHGEVDSMGRYFSVYQNNILQYRPTIFYSYAPCQAAYESLKESQINDYKLQDAIRVITDDIIDGVDELGIVLLGHHLNGWWIGSELSIHETRKVAPGQNATTLQVAAGLFGALLWLLENQQKGFRMPDDIPHNYIIEKTKPFLGRFSSQQVLWRPTNKKTKSKDEVWQFEQFLVN